MPKNIGNDIEFSFQNLEKGTMSHIDEQISGIVWGPVFQDVVRLVGEVSLEVDTAVKKGVRFKPIEKFT